MADEAVSQETTSTEVIDATESTDTDWKAEARKWESRAKQSHAAAKANEDAAKRLADLEDSQKTEAQKLQEERDKAQKDLADERTARIRAEVANSKGIPAKLLSGTTQEELEAQADELIRWRGEQATVDVAQEYSIPAAGRRPEVLALNGDGIESALKKALGI